MSSTNFTPNLGLCDWSASDKPKRADFVSDNNIIDTTLGSHISNSSIHLSPADREKLMSPYSVVSYSGTGSSTKAVDVEGNPKLVMVMQKFYPPVTVDSNGNTEVRFAVAYQGTGATSGVSISSNKVTVSNDTVAEDKIKNCLNEQYGQYMMILFK